MAWTHIAEEGHGAIDAKKGDVKADNVDIRHG